MLVSGGKGQLICVSVSMHAQVNEDSGSSGVGVKKCFNWLVNFSQRDSGAKVGSVGLSVSQSTTEMSQ